MNIGIFTDTYQPQINGVVTSIRMLEKELGKMGHKVFIITSADPSVPEPVPMVFRCPSMPFVFAPPHRATILYSPKLILNLRRLKLDIIHTQTEFSQGIFAKMVSEFYKIPMVHTYHTMYEEYVHYIANGRILTPSFAKAYSRIFCNRAQAVIAPTQKTKDYLESIGVIRPITTIATGLDFSPFAAENYTNDQILELKRSIGIDPKDPIVAVIGRIAKEKSIDVIISAFPKLLRMMPSAKLLIVGPGPYRDDLEKLVGDLDISRSVIFTGAVQWSEIPAYYRLGDVFASASTSETQGLTYVEAMAASVPVVVKKDRNVEGLVEHGQTGFCFERDEDAADMLYYALTHKDEAKVIAQNAISAIEDLSSARFAERVLDLYKSVIDMKARAQ